MAVEEADWPAGRVRLSAYVGSADLPAEIPGRVRCLVTDGSQVLITWDVTGHPDCFPGGGAAHGESAAETARREVLEETGWHVDVDSIEVLGWIHLESFAAWNPDLGFPHPDQFMTVLRAARAQAEPNQQTWIDTEGFVVRSEFVPLGEMPSEIAHSALSRVYLDLIFGTDWHTRSP